MRTLLCNKHLFLLIFITGFILQSQGQTGGNSVYSFLNLSNSARVAALGGNFLAIKDNDMDLALANPSLITPSMDNNLSLSFVDFYSDITYGYAMYSRTFKKIGSFTAAIQYLDYGNFLYADESGNTSGSFYVGDLAMSIGWGRQLDSSFSIGANLKAINSNYESYNSFGLAVDVTGSYFSKKNRLTLSFLARNIGRQISYYTPGNNESLPFELQFGLSQRLKHVPIRYSILLTNLQKWDLTYEDPSNPEQTNDPLTGEPLPEKKFEKFADKAMRHVVFGAELMPSKHLSLRIGYNYQRRKELRVQSKLSTVGISWGIGLHIYKFQLNYARSRWHLSGSPNYISITTNLSDFF